MFSITRIWSVVLSSTGLAVLLTGSARSVGDAFGTVTFKTAWVCLIVAGIMEWGWPLGLKFAWTGHAIRTGPAAMAVLCVLGSGLFLFLAQRTIPIGTAYAVWTGIGAIGTFVLGIIILGEPAQVSRFLCVGLIVTGIVGLKLVSAH